MEMEHRAHRARRAGLPPPVADWFGPSETEFLPPRLELVEAGLHAPWGERPRLVVRYSYASCPEDTETDRAWADDLGIADARWSAAFILRNARELALEWLAARERRMALGMMARTARWTNEAAAEARERGAA